MRVAPPRATRPAVALACIERLRAEVAAFGISLPSGPRVALLLTDFLGATAATSARLANAFFRAVLTRGTLAAGFFFLAAEDAAGLIFRAVFAPVVELASASVVAVAGPVGEDAVLAFELAGLGLADLTAEPSEARFERLIVTFF